MNIADFLNIFGLIFNISGAFLMFYFTPKVSFTTYLYDRSEHPKLKHSASRKNNLIRLGVFLLFAGFVLQFIALIIG